jgi:hypothetical protein
MKSQEAIVVKRWKEELAGCRYLVLEAVSRCLFNLLFHPKTKLRGLSQLENYTDRATAACRRS